MELNDIIGNFDKISTYFKLSLFESNKCYRGQCPLHDGDNPQSLAIFKEGPESGGIWKCYTAGCHEKYGTSIVGFVRGLLSVKNNNEVSISNTLAWIEQFFGGKYHAPISNLDTNLTKFLNRNPIIHGSFRITLKDFTSRLKKPQYFINRNYKEETLNHFNVGYCDNKLKPMYERVLVPQIDHDGYVIGCLGRSIYEQCQSCKFYHNPKDICKKFNKWKNSDNFPSSSTLYNFYGAKQYIEETGIILITESSPNVWRINEAGFPMVVGTFGSKFSLEQKELLDTVSCNTVIIVPDAGDAGQQLVNKVNEYCKYTHNIVTISPSYKDDIGACNIETTKNILGPFIDKACGSI